ncbi:MAG: tetratricopeptide repeat protein [Gemmatimonadaceae bacterium]
MTRRRSAAFGTALLVAALAGAWVTNARPDSPLRSVANDGADRDVQIATWHKALAADSRSAIALGQLAALHLQRARETGGIAGYDSAEHYARSSLAVRKDRNGASFATLGAALVARHAFAEADSVVTELVAVEPDVAEYRAMLGEIKLERGDYDGARIAFDSLHRMRTHLSIASRLARWMEINGKPDAARKLLRDAVAEATRRSDLPREQLAWFHLRLGDVEMRHGRMRSARAAFADGLRIAPEDHRLLSAMSRLEALEGNPRKAIEFGERAVAISFDPASLGVVGDAHAAMGHAAEADQYYKAMEVAIQGQPSQYHRAWSLLLLDRDRTIIDVLTSARTELKTRKDIHGYDVLAWAFHKSGRNVEARAAMAGAMRLGTRDATMYYHAGMIEVALSDTARARFFLQRALDINPRFHSTRPAAVRALLDSIRG